MTALRYKAQGEPFAVGDRVRVVHRVMAGAEDEIGVVTAVGKKTVTLSNGSKWTATTGRAWGGNWSYGRPFLRHIVETDYSDLERAGQLREVLVMSERVHRNGSTNGMVKDLTAAELTAYHQHLTAATALLDATKRRAIEALDRSKVVAP